ncbi:MAG: DUF413 domain-containing protein [Thalassotalea sp.]
METSIRMGSSPFYATDIFPRGLSRSSYFNKRESEELIRYGQTLTGLQAGTLTPENEEELQFIQDLSSAECSSLYPVKLWRKYLNAIQKSKTFHGFSHNTRATHLNFNQNSSNDLLNIGLAG